MPLQQGTMKRICGAMIVGGLILLMTPVAQAFTNDDVGQSAAKFLQIGVHGRAIAMGEAYSSISDGAESIYWNPAGLARIEKNAASLMHAVYFQDTSYEFGGYAHKFGFGAIGIGVQYLGSGSVDRTDENGIKQGTFEPNDLAITVGWGYSIWTKEQNGQELAVGVAGKFIQSKIVETAEAEAADVGVNWSPLEKLSLSFGAQNMGTPIKFKSESDALPLNVRMGSSYRLFKPLLLALDINLPNDNGLYAACGAEYAQAITTDITVFGRAGYNSRNASDLDGLSSLSAGGGLQWTNYNLDFAWVPFGDLGSTYRISISAKF